MPHSGNCKSLTLSSSWSSGRYRQVDRRLQRSVKEECLRGWLETPVCTDVQGDRGADPQEVSARPGIVMGIQAKEHQKAPPGGATKHMQRQTYLPTYMYAYTCTRMHAYMHTHTYVYLYKHIHTELQSSVVIPSGCFLQCCELLLSLAMCKASFKVLFFSGVNPFSISLSQWFPTQLPPWFSLTKCNSPFWWQWLKQALEVKTWTQNPDSYLPSHEPWEIYLTASNCTFPHLQSEEIFCEDEMESQPAPCLQHNQCSKSASPERMVFSIN